jgi:hypothetical protein
MNNDLQDVIEQADILIKSRKYKSAWKLLLPYQNEPAARKRLLWLQQKQVKGSKPDPVAEAVPNSRNQRRLYVLVAILVILGLSVLVIYRVSQQAPAAPNAAGVPTVVGEATQIVLAVTAMPSLIPTATELPPTENSHEVSLQQQLRDWLSTVQGVSQVLSFDVDIPDNEAPLAYVEVNVESGYNDTHIPDEIVQKLNSVLNTTNYSDLTVIMNDVSSIVQYSFDSTVSTWNQVVLASTPSSES